jgi:hypothetical protein
MRTTSDARPPSTVSPDEDGLPEVTADQPAWSGPAVLLIISGLVLFVALHFFRSNWTWLRPFLRDFSRWISDPHVAGGWPAPARPILAAAIALVAGVLGWLAARLLLRGTDFARERTLVAGIAITLGICVLGYGGMLGVVFGLLSVPALLAFYAAVAGALIWLSFRAERVDTTSTLDVLEVEEAARAAPGLLKATTGTLLAVIFLWNVAHAAFAPVQEWDAIVYHAESAKLWFQERPDPPLVYGPSVGIEISGNYPPLFPASGAAIYTILGRFDDLYLRLLPPLLFLSIALMTFGYARRRFDEDTACYAVLLLLGTPLLVMYGVWPTSYVLLASLVLATVILADAAVQAGSAVHWGAAGLVCGLAVLSHLYGVAAIPVGLAAIVLQTRGRRVLGPVLFVALALALASPWLLRNLILLHDPLYPVGIPPFHGKGLVEPIWSATQREIQTNAIEQMGATPGTSLRVWGLRMALFDKNLLPVGLYFGVLFGVSGWKRERVSAYLAIALSVVLFIALVPGWYWLRALVPALPVAAVLTGRGAKMLIDAGRARREDPPSLLSSFARVASVLAVASAFFIGCSSGLALAIAGPNQVTWTTKLSSGNNLMQAVEDFGSARQTLWDAFGGDALLWEWINQSVPAGVRAATLENRIYHLDRPTDLFYLDGREAAPLVGMRDPATVEQFFLDHGVRYVIVPAGTLSFPVVRSMPLFRLLGTDRFPAVAAFPIGGGSVPSLIYTVGPASVAPLVDVSLGQSQPPPNPYSKAFTIPIGTDQPRIFVPLGGKPSALEFSYDRTDVGPFDLNLYDPRTQTWQDGYYHQVRDGRPSWATAVVPIPPRRSFVDFGVHADVASLQIRNLRVVPLTEPVVQGARPARGGGWVVRPGADSRIWVPVDSSGLATISIRYLDADEGSFRLDVSQTDGTWRRGVLSRDLSGTRYWKTVHLNVAVSMPGFVSVKVVADGVDLQIDGVRLAS